MLAACGSGGSEASSKQSPTAAPAASPPATSADAILAQASRALGATSSYHVAGMLDPGLGVDLVVEPHAVTGTMSSHGVTWRVLCVGADVWLSGRELWVQTVGPARAAAFGDAWVRIADPSAAYGSVALVPHLHGSIAAIVFGPHPGLRVSGTATIGGRPTTELSGPKDTYDVASRGTPYPLRWLDRDIVGPGGQPCGITLDSFDAAVSVTPPAAVAATVTPAPKAATPTPLTLG